MENQFEGKLFNFMSSYGYIGADSYVTNVMIILSDNVINTNRYSLSPGVVERVTQWIMYTDYIAVVLAESPKYFYKFLFKIQPDNKT